MASVELITKEDLNQFKVELLSELKALFSTVNGPPIEKGSLKSLEVMKILNISAGTLQKLRNSNKLPFYMDEGVAKYEYEDIVRYKEERKNSYRKNRKNIPYFKG